MLTEEQLNARLAKIDAELSAQGLPLRYRPLQSLKAIHGAMQDKNLRDALLAAITNWFIKQYGDSAKWDGVVGRIPILIRGVVYLVAVPFTVGDQFLRLADHIEGLPQEVSSALTSEEFHNCGRTVAGMAAAFYRLYDLSVDDSFLDDVERGLVWRGLFDLENAANALKYSGDTQTAIFHSHAAAEKFLKVALKRSGANVALKSFGHVLPKVFEELISKRSRYAWLKSSVDSLQNFAPNMEIRYGVVPRNLENAVSAFNAALNICSALAKVWLFDKARGTEQATFAPGSFYVDGNGGTYMCRQLCETREKRPGAILRRFGTFSVLGDLTMDFSVDLDQSSFYLEIRDSQQVNDLQKRYQLHMQNLGKELKPENLGMRIHSGPEGSYTTASVQIELRYPGWRTRIIRPA